MPQIVSLPLPDPKDFRSRRLKIKNMSLRRMSEKTGISYNTIYAIESRGDCNYKHYKLIHEFLLSKGV